MEVDLLRTEVAILKEEEEGISRIRIILTSKERNTDCRYDRVLLPRRNTLPVGLELRQLIRE